MILYNFLEIIGFVLKEMNFNNGRRKRRCLNGWDMGRKIRSKSNNLEYRACIYLACSGRPKPAYGQKTQSHRMQGTPEWELATSL